MLYAAGLTRSLRVWSKKVFPGGDGEALALAQIQRRRVSSGEEEKIGRT